MTTQELLDLLKTRGLTVELLPNGQPTLKGNLAAVTPLLKQVLGYHREEILELLRGTSPVSRPAPVNQQRAVFYVLPGGQTIRAASPLLIPTTATSWQYAGESHWRSPSELGAGYEGQERNPDQSPRNARPVQSAAGRGTQRHSESACYPRLFE